MADQFDQEDPFKKYGGSAVADPDDPFKKYGGVQSAAPVKKKEPTASEFSVSLLQKATGTAGPSSPVLPKLPKQKKEIDQKELEDDPVGTVTKLVYSEAEPIPGYRDLSRPVSATTAVSQQTLLPEAREKKQKEITRTETSKPEYSLTFKEADKAVKEVKDYYQKSTNNAITHLMKSTGISDPDIFYSDAHQKIVEQRLRPGNQTDRLAYERVQEAKAAYNAIQEGGTLEDVAISFAAKRNPQVAKQIEKLQKSGVYASQNIGDILAGKQPEELKKLPRQAFDESTLGKYMFEAYTNSAFLQELERNPELLKQYQQEMPMLAQRYPDFGRKLYGDVISQKMEDMGINNAILNVVTKDEFDSVVNQAIADGDIEPYMKSFIDKEIRPRVGLRNFGAQIIGKPTVRTTGLFENTLEGGITGFTNIAKGTYELVGRNLMTPEQEQLKGDLAAEDSYVGVQPKGIVHEIATSGGQFLGQSLSIGGGGGIFKALGAVKNINKAVALSGGLQAYANYIPEARKKFPGEEIKQRGYASILAVTEMATENILKDRKVVEGLMGKMKPSVLNTIKDFTEKRITAEAAKNSLEEAIKKSLIGTKYLGRAMAENTAEEMAAKIAEQATTGVFTGVPLSQTVDGQELWDTGRQALLGSIFIGGLAARADIKRSKGVTAKTIYDMAENADYWRTQIQETGKQDEQLEKEVADKIKNLDYAQKIYTEIQGTGMDENQKIKFLITELEKKVAKDKADAITSDALKKKEKEIIKEAEQVQEDLLSGKDDGSIEGDESSKVSFTEEQQVLKDALPKISVGLFKDIAEQAAKSPESATQLLKEIADQVHGDELGNARQQQVDIYGKKVVDTAEKMFPKEEPLRKREELPIEREKSVIELNGVKIPDIEEIDDLLSNGDESWAYASTVKGLRKNIIEEMPYWEGDPVLKSQAEWLLEQIDSGKITETKSSFDDLVTQDVKNIQNDFKNGELGRLVTDLDESMTDESSELKRAIDDWTGLTLEEVKSGRGLNGIMSERRLQNLFDSNPEVIENPMKPIREYLSKKYGKYIILYRSEDVDFDKREKRSLLSYTSNPFVAKAFYNKENKKLIKERVPIEDIVFVTDRFNQSEFIVKSDDKKNISSPQKQTEYGQRQRDEAEGRQDVLTPGTEQQAAEQTASAASKKLSDKIRSLKIDISKMGDGGAQSNILGVPAALWNTSMDIIATAIDAGMSAADAIRRGLNHIQKNHRGQWDKKSFNDKVMKELGVRGITVNGEDLIVKDADKGFAETVNGFYSDLEQQVLDVKGNEGSPDSWLKVIGKSDEAKWTGLSEYLQSLPKDKKVSKKDVQQFLKDNRIQVVEVVKGEPKKQTIQLSKIKWESIGEDSDLYGDYDYVSSDGMYRVAEYSDGTKVLFDNEDLSISEIKSLNEDIEVDEDNTDTKFSQYQLEGQKDNYKEVLVTLPSESKSYHEKAKRYFDKNEELKEYRNKYSPRRRGEDIVEYQDRYKKQLANDEVYQKLVRESDELEMEYNSANEKKLSEFKSSHFDEPNILVHIRMNTRTDADGSKVLFLEEVQSDWGQKGKSEGFGEKPKKSFIIKDRSGQILMESDTREGVEEMIDYYKSRHGAVGIEERVATDWAISGDSKKIPSAPFVTETTSWTKLGLKVALKEAVKQGADKIAWTTGEQQNERYDLSKQVDKVSIANLDSGYEVEVVEKGKGFWTKVASDISAEKLAEYVGKELAQKHIDSGKDAAQYEGLDLKVGGKGMKGFYGSPSEGKLGIIGEVAKSLFKQEPKTVEVTGQFTKQKESELKGGRFAIMENGEQIRTNLSESQADFLLDKFKKENDTKPIYQHSITITPELKQEAESGLPLFKDIKGRGKEIADLLRKGKIKSSGLQSNIAGIPIALWNAAIDTIAAAIEGGASLAQAIKKAIDQHKLRDQKDFNQNEFIKKLEEATGEKFTDEAPPAEPPKEEKKSVYVQRPRTELSHRGLQDVANEFSLPDVKTRDRKSDTDLLQEARETVDDWAEKGQYAKNIESLIQEAEQGGVLTDKERVIMEQHLSNLTEEARQLDPRTPEWDNKFKEIVRLKNAGEKTRSEAGAALRIPSFRSGPRTIIDEMAEEAQSAGVDQLTDNQKQIVQREYDNEQRLIEELKQKVAKLEEENEQLRAGENISKERKRSRKGKKTDEQYKEERKKILDDIKEKWAKSKGDTQVTVLPYANQLIAIAPDVKKLVTSFLGQGITELSDIIDNIHDAVSPIIPDVTKKDIRAIIAGEYNEKKPTRNQLAAQVRDLQDEAYLLQKLEALESGQEPKSEKKKIERNRKIADLRKQIKEHDVTKLAERKKNIKAQIEKISKQIESGDFSTPIKKPKIKLDREGQELERQLINIRKERMVRRLKNEYAKRTLWQVGMDKVAEVANIPRAIMASTDFSAPLNQAIVATIAHPSMAKNAAIQMFKSAFSQKEFDSWFYGLKDDPRYELMKELKLKISDPHSPFLTAREEAFMSGYAEQIPVAGRLIKGSERAYVQYLNKMRVDLFNRFIDRFEEQGKTYDNSKKLYEKTARYINNITGAGNLGKMEQFAPILSGLLFSPRLMASRLNLLNPVYFASLPNELKKQYAYDMGKFLGLGSMILTLFYLYGKTQDDDDEDKIAVETDPRSSDFAKIKQGNTRWNMWGGFQPYVRLGAQLATGQRKSANTGLVQDLSGEGAFGTTPLDQSASFLRGKLAPVPSSVIDLLSGRNIVGEKVTLKSEAQEWVTPLGIGGVIEGWKERGVMSLVSIGLPSVFGIGTQTYGERKQNIPEKLRINNKEVVLTDEQKKELDNFVSDNTKRKLDKVRDLKEYKDLDREQQVALETQVKRASLAEGKEWLEKKYKDKWPKETRAERDARVKKERDKKKLMRKLEE